MFVVFLKEVPYENRGHCDQCLFIFGSNILYLCNKDTVRRKHRMLKV